jgi:hypothetical protein
MSDPYEDHDLRHVWNYVKSNPDMYHTARMHSDKGQDWVDIYPRDDVSEEDVIEDITDDFDVEHSTEDEEYNPDQVRFVPE